MDVIEGQVIKVKRNPGSKSEHWGYLLRAIDGHEVSLEAAGDNPFEHQTVAPFAGRTVRAEGQLYRGRMVASKIEPLDSTF